MNIRGIPSFLIDKFWPLAEPYIKRALERGHGEWEPQDIKDACRDQIMQLWLVSDNDKVIGAVTTQIVIYPRRKHCRIVTLAGSRAQEWISDSAKIVFDWAKQQGCEAVEANVRKGFVPRLVADGYEHTHSVIYKDI